MVTQPLLTSLGVTTNSENGVADVEAFYPTFAAMEENDMGKLVSYLSPCAQ